MRMHKEKYWKQDCPTAGLPLAQEGKLSRDWALADTESEQQLPAHPDVRASVLGQTQPLSSPEQTSFHD